MKAKFQLYTDKPGDFRFALIATNGTIIGISESYDTKSEVLLGMRSAEEIIAISRRSYHFDAIYAKASQLSSNPDYGHYAG
ncbi:MAG: YegP family protein [Dehalogenimonas sp.]